MYYCINPITGLCIETPLMGEADFWASLGYAIFDAYAPYH